MFSFIIITLGLIILHFCTPGFLWQLWSHHWPDPLSKCRWSIHQATSGRFAMLIFEVTYNPCYGRESDSFLSYLHEILLYFCWFNPSVLSHTTMNKMSIFSMELPIMPPRHWFNSTIDLVSFNNSPDSSRVSMKFLS